MTDNNPHEQILQLLITGGFLDPGKLKEARDIIGKCASSGSLEEAAEEYLNEKPDWATDQNHFHTTRSIYLGDMKAAFLAGAKQYSTLTAPADEIEGSISEGEERRLNRQEDNNELLGKCLNMLRFLYMNEYCGDHGAEVRELITPKPHRKQ